MSSPTSRLTLTRPDDWHLHVRDGVAMRDVVPHTAAQFRRAIIMPNLKPPVTTVEQALAYRERILQAVPEGVDFEPLMTLYLTDNLPPEEIAKAHAAGVVALKLYPAGATTNSDAGVTDIRNTYATLEAMQKHGLKLLVHGEVTNADIDLFDREAVFIDRHLIPLRRDFPELDIVFEHITSREAAQYVASADARVGATITAHHLLYNRNAIFTGGIRPHYYCLPVLKREEDRQALSTTEFSWEELPGVEDLKAGEPVLSPTIVGLFRPAEEGHRDAILIYRRNLLRICRTEEELHREVRDTILHELGHLGGADDAELRDRGL